MIIDLDRTWVRDAICVGMDPDVFFTDHAPNSVYNNRPTKRVLGQWDKAKIICGNCPVRRQCARDHLGEIEGVWGGLDPAQRMILRKEHSVNVRKLTGPVKAEYAKLAWDLKRAHLPFHEVARMIGINIKTAQYLYDWHKAEIKAKTQKVLELPSVPKVRSSVGRGRKDFPKAAPANGEGWVRVGSDTRFAPAHYRGQTPEGDWFLMRVHLGSESSICWVKSYDVALRREVVPVIKLRVKKESKFYGTSISRGQRQEAG